MHSWTTMTPTAPPSGGSRAVSVKTKDASGRKTMHEYIDKIAFRAAIDGIHPFTKDGQRDPKWNYAKKEFLSALARFPAADVVEQKTGKWIHLGGDEWCCSSCGYVITTEGSWEHPIDTDALYCKHCGAKMEGNGDV